MIAFGFFSLIYSPFAGLFFSWGYAFSGLVTLLCGIAALKGWDKLDAMHWPIILIIVGGLGGGIGGLLRCGRNIRHRL